MLLVLLSVVLILPPLGNASATDTVRISGYVRDLDRKPIRDVSVIINSIAPPWQDYGYTVTDAGGSYTFTISRPKHLDIPVPNARGLPIYEGCRVLVGWQSEQWLPITDQRVDTENKTLVRQDFVLRPAGILKLKGYTPEGRLIESYSVATSEEYSEYPAYTTDLYWRVTQGVFAQDRAAFLLSLNTSHVLNLPWTAPGFGRLLLRADNDGKGFTFGRQGETMMINLNYEIASTEFRLLKQSYKSYIAQGHVFSNILSSGIQIAQDALEKAHAAPTDVQKANLADLSLNRTLWTAESLEFARASQDIEKYRKGNATLTLVDQDGKPIKDASLTVTQMTHDFLFGASLEGPIDLQAFGLLMQAGINYGHFEFCWGSTEPLIGQYRLNENPPFLFKSLSEMGLNMGGGCLFLLEAGPDTYPTGLVDLTFEQLRTKVYEHVHRIASEYSPYVDLWTISHNMNRQYDCLGFSQPQVLDLIKTAIEAVRSVDPESKVMLYIDDPAGDKTTADDPDAHTYFSKLSENGIDIDGAVLGVEYGSLYEWYPGSGLYGAQSPMPFMDLGSISRMFDWYNTLPMPLHAEIHAPAKFKSDLGYWHKRSWDQELQAEWVESCYTILFSKPLMREITYMYVMDRDYQRAGRGLLDVNYAPRESFYTLKRLINEKWTTRLQLRTDAMGQVEFGGFAGNYTVNVAVGDLVKNYKIHVAEGRADTYRMAFDANEVRKEMEAQRLKLRSEAEDVLREVDRIRQWTESVSKARSITATSTMNELTRLFEGERYVQVILTGKQFIQNPFGINLTGRLSDFEGLAPIVTDEENDAAPSAPPGTDLMATYGLADSSSLYLGVRVRGDNPNSSAIFTVETLIGYQKFHVTVQMSEAGLHCRCFEQPWNEHGINFDCTYGFDEIVEMRVPLRQLGLPREIYLANVWIWLETGAPGGHDYDWYDGPPVEVPTLRSFNATTTLRIETAELTTSIVSSGPIAVELQDSLPFVAAICAVVITGIAATWRRRIRRPQP